MQQKFFVLLTTLTITSKIWTQTNLVPNDKEEIKTSMINSIINSMESRIKKVVLKNNIRLIMMKNPGSPTIATSLKIGVGSANESFDIAGTAHFLEHLLFKGTKTLGTTNFEKEKDYLEQIRIEGERIDNLQLQLADPLISKEKRAAIQEKLKNRKYRLSIWQKGAHKYVITTEYSQIYKTAGGRNYNAYTSSDLTNYKIKLPNNRLEIWAKIESNRFINTVFREYYEERKVIEEERRMTTDANPTRKLSELFRKTHFGFSPYGKPVIGFANNIPRLRYSDTEKFFKDNYTTDRMVISLVGDLNFDETEAVIRKYFEKIPVSKAPKFPPINLTKEPGKREAWVKMSNPTSPAIILGWYRPNLKHPDASIFEDLSSILTGTNQSRLFQRLVIKEKLCSSVSSYPGSPGEKLENSIVIKAYPFKYGNYKKVESIIKEELSNLAKNGITEDEMTLLKNQTASFLFKKLKTNEGLAEILSYYEVMAHDYQMLYTILQKTEKLKSQDFQRIIKTYFTEENQTTVWIEKGEAELK